jgi:hypothetical protein
MESDAYMAVAVSALNKAEATTMLEDLQIILCGGLCE